MPQGLKRWHTELNKESNDNEVIKSKVANKADGARKIPEEDIQNVL